MKAKPDITLYGVGSVEEEVGLRGAQTSAEHIKPDVVVVLDTAVAGDVPGIDGIKYPLKLGKGPGLMLFDKRYFPNQQLVAALKARAQSSGAPLQFCTMKTGATDGGRYNVMGGGRPVAALCLPTRYLHANSGMVSRADYDALFTLARELLTSLTTEKVKAFTDFRQVNDTQTHSSCIKAANKCIPGSVQTVRDQGDKSAGADLNAARSGPEGVRPKDGPSNAQPTQKQLEGGSVYVIGTPVKARGHPRTAALPAGRTGATDWRVEPHYSARY